MSDDAPSPDDLMPWSVPALRLGRSWVTAADAATLRARWRTLTSAADPAERARLFGPTRARGTSSVVAQLPGGRPSAGRIAQEGGPCPEPVPFLRGGWDSGLLVPDHRLIDAARPEVWRVADAAQYYAVEAGGEFAVAGVLPDGRSAAGRAGRIRPLYRRPGALEPNVLPGLLDLLARRLGLPVTAPGLLAWTAAAWRPAQRGGVVPLPAGPELWEAGVALGGELIDARTGGIWSGRRIRLPGGRRPYVRVPLPPRPAGLWYDAAAETLWVGAGAIAPVPRAVWEFTSDGVRVVEAWFSARAAPWLSLEAAPAGTQAPGPGDVPGAACGSLVRRERDGGALEAVGPDAWRREWTTGLLELLTAIGLWTAAGTRRRELAAALDRGPRTDRADLRAAGLLPAPPASRRPASVLDHHEEGPGGQLALM